MRRRHFLFIVGTAAIGLATGNAQQRKVPTIGVLVVRVPGGEQFWRLFREDMRQLGYIERQSIRYEFRSDVGQENRLSELDAELVHLNVDPIVTWYTPRAQGAKRATRENPIVMALAGNPVETVIVASLDRPGGYMAGMAGAAAELAVRRRIPAVSVIHGFVEEGGLMSYAPSEAEIYCRAAAIVDKILKAPNPSHVPVEQPTKFELLINMKNAKAPSLLARADVVIE